VRAGVFRAAGTLGKSSRCPTWKIFGDVEDIEANIAVVDAKIDEAIAPYRAVLQRLTTIPGVDRVVAVTISGRPLGYVPVARSRPKRGITRRAYGGAATTSTTSAEARRGRRDATAGREISRRMASERASQQRLLRLETAVEVNTRNPRPERSRALVERELRGRLGRQVAC